MMDKMLASVSQNPIGLKTMVNRVGFRNLACPTHDRPAEGVVWSRTDTRYADGEVDVSASTEFTCSCVYLVHSWRDGDYQIVNQ